MAKRKRKQKKELNLFWKFAISILLDAADFGIGLLSKFVPVAGQVGETAFDIIIGAFCIKYWGNEGWLAMWEALEFTGTVDSFIPTATLVGIISTVRKNIK